jgi:hypothetical protein
MKKMFLDDFEFDLKCKTDYSSLYINEQLKMAICVADEEYIPIDNFKDTFLRISELIKEIEIKNLVFDKRKLRTFHQPSMEWYFAVWKPEMKKQGLTSHFKILPKLDWFEKAVEAGKYEIFQKFSKEILNGISIKYVTSVEEALHNINTTQENQ